ncbi:MAG: tetratricopeptide repeat protein [Candidatus Sumerlaeia bacterium]|nr:tetratricopeptide repeat protein [Candidatus Sumerlaeia bacterium]
MRTTDLFAALGAAAALFAGANAQEPALINKPGSAEPIILPREIEKSDKKATMIIRAQNGAQFDVYIDGTRLGLTPIRGDIPTGTRLLTATAESFAPIIEPVRIVEGDPIEIVLPNEPLTPAIMPRITQNIVSALQAQPNNQHVSLMASMTATDDADAMRMLSRAEQIGQPSPLSLLLQGRRLQLDRSYDASLAALDRGLALDPNYAALHRQRARTLTQMDRLEEAVVFASKAIDLDKFDWNNHYVRGRILVQMKRPELALQEYRNALVLLPGNQLVISAIEEAQGATPQAEPAQQEAPKGE